MTTKKKKEAPIDVVISWVDGNDAKHQAKMLPFLSNKETFKSEKFKRRFKQVDEIKFSIDSILKFAPYIRNIFVITDNQKPHLANSKAEEEKYKKVIIVDHKTIFRGYEEHLPVFNSRAIETVMFRIPELAEHFIYLNDDFFIINPTKKEDFFVNGLPVLRGKWLKFDSDIFYKKTKKNRTGHKLAQQLSAKLIGFKKYYNFRHTPHPFRKSTFEEYFKSNEEILEDNIKYRFRDKKQFLIQGIANHLEIKNGTCVLKKDLQLMYFRSYKKPLVWYKFKLNNKSKGKLFLGMQSLNVCPPLVLKFLLKWLEKRMA